MERVRSSDSLQFEVLLTNFKKQPDSTNLKPDEALTLLQLVEKIIESGSKRFIGQNIWHEYLQFTGRPQFLQSLPNEETRQQWVDTVFKIIDFSNYTLLNLFEQRVKENSDIPLFIETKDMLTFKWSYSRVYKRVTQIATAFKKEKEEPRVGIFLENSVDGACSDLAALFYNILVTPLNVHFDVETLVYICDLLDLNIIVTDTDVRLHTLTEVQRITKRPFKIFVTDQRNALLRNEDNYLAEICSRLSSEEIDETLAGKGKKSLHDIATVMFTSGSTGKPKGVSYTQFNLITKRFARAAALPKVGKDEILLCYLPLFHTFGRYLEMLGSIYWGGTYCFAGNPSAETLIRLLKQIKPTGLIGIPLRWQQIKEKCLQQEESTKSSKKQAAAFRNTVGSNLRWGLSAAGYLDPKIFRYFQKNRVDLCSGFGMTEATGGITMTPPGDYKDNSVGKPLPGMKLKFTDIGEMLISGAYVARYLSAKKTKNLLAPFNALIEDNWLPTGDLFRMRDDGHYEIIDRIKDIYKNNRGQTVAPRRVEQKFEGVPGIKRSFLVGDEKDYNVLLIVPDLDESELIEAARTEENEYAYFNKIVTTANTELAPYERVINIALLKRDFSKDKKELTAKGSFSRKTITKNFAETIDKLYEKRYTELDYKGIEIKIPRWFFRDMGILESDIVVSETGLYNKNTNLNLRIESNSDDYYCLIGDLKYRIDDNAIDMGLFARQPKLWSGNPSLIAFCPCKEGWDMPLDGISEQILLPAREKIIEIANIENSLNHVRNQQLIWVNSLAVQALFSSLKKSLDAVNQLEKILYEADTSIASIIRSRLEALAHHPEEKVRCLAYSILLLDEPMPDYSSVFPAFIQSGLSFLNEETITRIAKKNFEKRRLEALRMRLNNYRTHLKWPAIEVVRKQFENTFLLIANFARSKPEFYDTVRAELASWIIYETDTALTKAAERILNELVDWFESRLEASVTKYDRKEWLDRLVFDDTISDFEKKKIHKIFINTTFLHQSIMLAFDTDNCDLMQIPHKGIWISRTLSQRHNHHYRISVNTNTGKHYDLMLTLREDFDKESVQKALYWLVAISGYPYRQPPLPRFGCCRPELGALSVVYIIDLTVWERIREYNSSRSGEFARPQKNFLKKLLTRAMTTYISGCRNSGFKIVPGFVNPVNTVVPEPDFKTGATILSLSGWLPYENTLSLVKPIVRNFYEKISAHFPWTRSDLNYSWIFDACMEELGKNQTVRFLNTMKDDLKKDKKFEYRKQFLEKIESYLTKINDQYYVPIAVQNAIDRYNDWLRMNPKATNAACDGIIRELLRLYRIDKFNEIARYYLYRQTYFTQASEDIRTAFDYLLHVMYKNPRSLSTSLMELSDLQNHITEKFDMQVFSLMVFPRAERGSKIEVKALGESDKKMVVLQSEIIDKNKKSYHVRDATEPSEIGQLYRMFIRQQYPISISQKDNFYIVFDKNEQIVGGICYKYLSQGVVNIDGIVIAITLKNSGVGSALLEDFCSRKENEGYKIVKTHFFLRDYYLKRNFQVDKRWGGLVRFLAPLDPEAPDVSAVEFSKRSD